MAPSPIDAFFIFEENNLQDLSNNAKLIRFTPSNDTGRFHMRVTADEKIIVFFTYVATVFLSAENPCATTQFIR